MSNQVESAKVVGGVRLCSSSRFNNIRDPTAGSQNTLRSKSPTSASPPNAGGRAARCRGVSGSAGRGLGRKGGLSHASGCFSAEDAVD